MFIGQYCIIAPMKKDIHPENYRPVIFVDTSSDARFLICSTVSTKETAKWEDGKEYPLFNIEISRASHPFYTGTDKSIDSAGRVERFKKRAEMASASAKKKVSEAGK